jgi:uncharacterized membrane protein
VISPSRDSSSRVLAALIGVWAVVYSARAILGHLALRTNAYDLSVFDYALWSTTQGHIGFVPFMGESLLSQHVMPTLGLVLPAYLLLPSPWLLIGLQLATFAAAAVLLCRFFPGGLPVLPRLAILCAFLFGRRSHSAVTSYFYIESFEPLLVCALLLLWRAGRVRWAALVGFLALGCKEDMALYFIAWGGLIFFQESKRRGATIALLSAVWLVVSVWWAVPTMRRMEGLPASNPFVGSIADTASQADALEARVLSLPTAQTFVKVTAGTGFLCWLAPELFAIAFPGLLVTLVANPHTRTIGISGHYLFPVLPWLFVAAAVGAGRLHAYSANAIRWLSVALIIGTAFDNPTWQGLGRDLAEFEKAGPARRQLALIPNDVPVLAMPNVIPHLAHRPHVWALGTKQAEAALPDYVVLTTVGVLWPLDGAQVESTIRRYRADPAFVELSSGPTFIYRRR